ncbi:chloroplastic import inner membrane translocase subunit HP30-2-like [Physcomitrium patens]|uniref:SAM domain-containing protein n=1 Tax=Physcomitrium patens TaxID=3218 RepID=A0A2K1J952_PHYPA|nr:hypothetical protein PHYPA_021164 [Physcomitrium patens]PNR38056.1 hypothetical protein PHYPA_021167 [Physcomitrium patens]
MRVRMAWAKLILQKYEKNFKKGMSTDSTLHLLNDSSLRDVQIPPGPRLLILDHLKRFGDVARRSS